MGRDAVQVDGDAQGAWMKAIQSTVWAIVQLVGAKPRGPVDMDAVVWGTCPVEQYRPSYVTFVRKASYLPYLEPLRDAVVLITPELADQAGVAGERNTLLVVDDVADALISVQAYIYGNPPPATAMAALRAHGHEVGLHYEPDPDGQSEVAWDDASKVALAADKARLIGVAGEPMEGAAAHRPAKAGALTPEQVRSVGFAYEATGPTLEAASPRWKYLADSRGQWREGCICGWLGNVDRLIMVVHPIWWTGGQADRANILERLGRGD
jgi:hypothetical protein